MSTIYAHSKDCTCTDCTGGGPTTWKVYKKDKRYYVKDLDADFRCYPRDALLLYVYPEGDVGSPDTPEKMLGVLYDLYQCEDTLKEGDMFETPHGKFKCVSVHVVPA